MANEEQPQGQPGQQPEHKHKHDEHGASGSPPLSAFTGSDLVGDPTPRSSTGDIITIAIVALVFLVAVTFLNIGSFLKVLLGLSFVIFIHELGHFLVAKMCDVHVTHFSIGFGPAIPGCRFQWGETTYQVCLLPLGGYVQMVGQVDGDESSDGSENDPRSYRNKSVGQRMAIISAGVIMNVILALIIFIVIYRGPGHPREAAIIGDVEPGGPAFVAGLRTGMEIEEIAGIKKPYFDDLRLEVGYSSAGQVFTLVVQPLPELDDAGKPKNTPKDITLELEPRKSKTDKNPVLGVTSSQSLALADKYGVDSSWKGPAIPGSAAGKAEPPIEFGDVIIGMTDPATGKVTDLPPDPRKPDQKSYFEYLRRMQLLAGDEIVLRVQRKDAVVDIAVPVQYHNSFGAAMQMGHVVALRAGSPADGKLQVPVDPSNGQKFQSGDVIEKVEVVDADGKPLVFEQQTLDPVRLPYDLKRWAQKLAAAGKIDGAKATLTVRRHSKDAGVEFEKKTIELPWDNSWAFDRLIGHSPHSPTAIAELGIAYTVRPIVASADSGSKLKAGDVIKNIQVVSLDSKGKETTSSWYPSEAIKTDSWALQGLLLASANNLKKIKFKVDRNKQIEEIEIEPTADTTWPRTLRGFTVLPDKRIQKADTTIEAISFGLTDTKRMMIAILNGIRQMVGGRIDYKEGLGGPLMIANIAYSVAGSGFWEFLYFLAMISVNLAVINFLPIPVLDGGHMVFLIYEKLRGKPASEGFRMAATYMGLAFILCLIVFVTYLDIGRMIRG